MYIYIYVDQFYILVGGFNHLEKYESQWEGFSHILWKIKYVWNHRPVFQVELYLAFHIHIYVYMWANYNNSLTWNKTKLEYIIPLTNHYSRLRSQWGNYNLPRYAYIYVYIYIASIGCSKFQMLFHQVHDPWSDILHIHLTGAVEKAIEKASVFFFWGGM